MLLAPVETHTIAPTLFAKNAKKAGARRITTTRLFKESTGLWTNGVIPTQSLAAMLQQDRSKQRILEMLNLEDTSRASCAFAIERSRGVSVNQAVLLNDSLCAQTGYDCSTQRRA